MKLRNFGIKSRLLLKKIIIDVRHTHLRDLRNGFLSSLKKIPDIVHLKNLVLFGSILAIFTLSLFVQRFAALHNYYFVEKPDFGGTYTQGVVGTVEKINPLFIQNDAEKAANQLVFSGLTRTINGTKVIPDLAESWESQDSGKAYLFRLRKDVLWHDGEKFTADDVVYTYGLIQNADTKTDLFSTWKGVSVEKVNDYEVRFKLNGPHPAFLSSCRQAILPKHLLSSTDAKNIKIAEFNLSPVGTGPFKFLRFDQLGKNSEVIFVRNDKFAIAKPYLEQIKLVMFDDEKDEFDSLSRKQIDGIMKVFPQNYDNFDKIGGDNIYRKLLPDYEVVYFNTKNPLLSNKDLRVALSAGINREELIKDVLKGNGELQSTPLLPGQSGYDSKVKGIVYNPEAAGQILDKLGWVKGDSGVRSKEGKSLSFKLSFPDNQESSDVAEIIKENYAKLGINLDLQPVHEEEVGANIISARNFELLLINQNVGFEEDWYSLWHSSQIASPGLNISAFSDKKMDRFLEQVLTSTDKAYRAERMKESQQIIIDNAPIVYLYRPTHIFAVSNKFKGLEQSRMSQKTDLLNNIYLWYTRVKG